MSTNCKTIVIIPQQDRVESTLEIVVNPNSDKVIVMELFSYGDFEYAGFNDEHRHLPTHMVNDIFEAPASSVDLAEALKKKDLIDSDIGSCSPMKCIVHVNHLLDEEPIVCPNLTSAILVARLVAEHA